METRKFFISFIFLTILSINAVVAKTHEVSFNEGENFSISCNQPNLALKITKATWEYDRLSARNMLTPNWRNLVFAFGPNIGVGTWDVTNYAIIKACNGRLKCEFTIRQNDFQPIWYEMILSAEYECLPVCGEVAAASSHTKRKRQIGVCLNTRGWSISQIADYLETVYPTRRTLNNMGSITSLTTRNVTYGNRAPVELVYVARAHLTQQSRRTGARNQFPAGVQRRMSDLSAIRGEDDRGHIIADCLGGPVNVLNIFPQYKELNRACYKNGTSLWNQMEREFHRNLGNPQISYDLTVVLRYDAPQLMGNFRPIGIGLHVVRYTTSNGVIVNTDTSEHYFSNEVHLDVGLEMIPERWFN